MPVQHLYKRNEKSCVRRRRTFFRDTRRNAFLQLLAPTRKVNNNFFYIREMKT